MLNERFPRRCRLTQASEIVRVGAEGMRERTPWFTVRRASSSLSHARVAIIVPRYDQTAVARNRIKRRLRELVRRELLSVAVGQDVVLRVTPAGYRARFDELRDAIRHIAQRTGGVR